MKGSEENKIELLESIANEIAEQNRLTRISLTNNFIQAATSSLYKQGKNEKGEPIVLAPTEEEQAAYEKSVAAIEFALSDHMGKIDEEEIKKIQEQAQAEIKKEEKIEGEAIEKKEGDQNVP
jgi:hypothetical protein